jgi:hypothetical protein
MDTTTLPPPRRAGSRAARELQQAAERGDAPVASSALFAGTDLLIEQLEAENQRLRAQLRAIVNTEQHAA